jgi:hypothetical protein
MEAEGQPVAPGERLAPALNIVSPGYFASLEIPILDGRDVLPTDDAASPDVVVISQSLARKLWPGERAVGKRIDALGFVPGTPRWLEVIGVVGDLHGASLTETAEPALYVPVAELGVRTNAQRLFAAIAAENPYPARHFGALQFNQMVLKAVFVEVSVLRIEGLAERRTPELARMAEAYASERRAAGGPVPEDIARILGCHAR